MFFVPLRQKQPARELLLGLTMTCIKSLTNPSCALGRTPLESLSLLWGLPGLTKSEVISSWGVLKMSLMAHEVSQKYQSFSSWDEQALYGSLGFIVIYDRRPPLLMVFWSLKWMKWSEEIVFSKCLSKETVRCSSFLVVWFKTPLSSLSQMRNPCLLCTW